MVKDQDSENSWDMELITAVSADGLAPVGARPSADTMMTTKSGNISKVSVATNGF